MTLRKHKWVYVDNFRFKSQKKAFKLLNKNAKILFFHDDTMACDMVVNVEYLKFQAVKEIVNGVMRNRHSKYFIHPVDAREVIQYSFL